MPKKVVKKYIPNKKEKYMCAKHKKYFSQRLTSWRKEIFKSNNDNVVLNNLDDNVSSADIRKELFEGANIRTRETDKRDKENQKQKDSIAMEVTEKKD